MYEVVAQEPESGKTYFLVRYNTAIEIEVHCKAIWEKWVKREKKTARKKKRKSQKVREICKITKRTEIEILKNVGKEKKI